MPLCCWPWFWGCLFKLFSLEIHIFNLPNTKIKQNVARNTCWRSWAPETPSYFAKHPFCCSYFEKTAEDSASSVTIVIYFLNYIYQIFGIFLKNCIIDYFCYVKIFISYNAIIYSLDSKVPVYSNWSYTAQENKLNFIKTFLYL